MDQSPYRQGKPLADVIPPDRRHIKAAAIAFACVMAGAVLTKGAEELFDPSSGIATAGILDAKGRGFARDFTPAQIEATPAPAEDGILTVICFPACDDVFVDGKSFGPSPVWQRPVTPGEHRVKMMGPHATKVVSIDVPPGERKTLKMPMLP